MELYFSDILNYTNFKEIALLNNLALDKLRLFYFMSEIKCMMMLQLKRNISSFNSRLNLRRLMPEYIILRNKCSGRWRSFFYNITLYLHTTRKSLMETRPKHIFIWSRGMNYFYLYLFVWINKTQDKYNFIYTIIASFN